MKTRLKIIIVGIVLASIVFGTYQSLMYQCGTLPVFMETPRNPNLWNCLEIWENQSEEPQPQKILTDPICFVVDRATSGETGSAVTMDTCFTLNQFEEMGCTKPMLEHILRYSNLLDEEADGQFYLDWAGLPDGIIQEKFQECFDAILEKRTPIKEISDLKFRQSNCENFGGTWLSKPNECEGITKSQCGQMNAAYSEESSCRYHPNPDDCFTDTVSVCSEYSESDYELLISDCPDGQDYNEVLFKCVISCEDDLVYNGYTDSCTTEFELKYHGFCNEGYTYQPSTHTCLSDSDGFPVNLSHEPLKDPPRTAPPEPESEITPRYEKYLDENNELNFALPYDRNGMIIDDLQRIFDWCDYPGEKPDWYFEWNNQTHHINSENCEWMEKEN